MRSQPNCCEVMWLLLLLLSLLLLSFVVVFVVVVVLNVYVVVKATSKVDLMLHSMEVEFPGGGWWCGVVWCEQQ